MVDADDVVPPQVPSNRENATRVSRRSSSGSPTLVRDSFSVQLAGLRVVVCTVYMDRCLLFSHSKHLQSNREKPFCTLWWSGVLRAAH